MHQDSGSYVHWDREPDVYYKKATTGTEFPKTYQSTFITRR